MLVAALLTAVVLNWLATLLSTIALEKANASLVSPLFTFNPFWGYAPYSRTRVS